MSLILEALRKSEAERRRGALPELLDESPPVAASRARGFPAWVGWTLAVSALALAAWLALRGASDPAITTDNGTRTAAPDTDVQPAPAVPPPTRAELPAPTPQPPSATAPVAAANAQPAATTTASPTLDTRPGASPDAPTASTDPSAVAPSAPAPAPAVEPAAPAAPPVAATGTESVDNSASDSVIELNDLDSGTRASLPPLKMTMHLWDPSPARRMVILDGQRLSEGDQVGAATLTRIERDGILLEWNGRGIHVPAR